MEGKLFAILLTIVIVSGIGYSYGVEVTVDVPHPFNYDDCDTFSDELGIPFTQCLFKGYATENPDLMWDEDTHTYISVTQMEEEAKAIYEEFIEQKEAKMTAEQKAVSNILEQDDDKISTAEKQLVVMANKIKSQCKNDILAMQTYQEFEVATETYIDENGNERLKLFKNWDLAAINLKQHQLLKEGKMAVEHCLAQENLNKNTLSLNIYGEQSYEGKEVCVYGCNTYHAEHTYNEEFQSKVAAMMETGGNVVAPPTLRDTICNSDTIGAWFKQQNACPITYISTIPQPVYEELPEYTSGLSVRPTWSDESRELIQSRADYNTSDKSQYDKVVAEAIDDKMENLR